MRAAFVWAVLGAVGIHGAALVAIQRAGDPASRRVPPTIRSAGDLLQVRIVSVTPALRVAPTAPLEVPTHLDTPSPRSKPAETQPVRPAERENANATSDKGTYFERGALDRLAEPVGEWTIDTSLLPLTGESTFQATIWVSAAGEIEKWEITSTVLGDDVTTAIFARLNDTVMNPALIGTRPVASVLRFELSAERQ